MSWLSRFINVFRRVWLNRDLDDEIAFHITERAEEFTRRGVSAPGAVQEAHQRFGNKLLLRESSREVELLARLESIAQDIGFGLRLFRNNAVVTAAALLSLALAIGACAAAFSLIDALILRPLPVQDPHSLVYVASRSARAPADESSFNYPLFKRMRDASRGRAKLLMAILGLGVGLATGMAASRFIRALLYQVEPSDWWSVAGPLVCLLLVCVLSALPPAMRAVRVDPVTALRYE